jgi:DNA-binding MarR family transcriptional regulator
MLKTNIKENVLQTWYNLLKFHAGITQKIDRELSRKGLIPIAWFDVLIALENSPGKKMRMNELAESCALTKSGITKIINTLEEKKLVLRTRCPNDARGLYAEMLQAGSSSIKKARPTYESCLLKFLSEPLSADESNYLNQILQKLLAVQKLNPVE